MGLVNKLMLACGFGKKPPVVDSINSRELSEAIIALKKPELVLAHFQVKTSYGVGLLGIAWARVSTLLTVSLATLGGGIWLWRQQSEPDLFGLSALRWMLVVLAPCFALGLVHLLRAIGSRQSYVPADWREFVEGVRGEQPIVAEARHDLTQDFLVHNWMSVADELDRASVAQLHSAVWATRFLITTAIGWFLVAIIWLAFWSDVDPSPPPAHVENFNFSLFAIPPDNTLPPNPPPND